MFRHYRVILRGVSINTLPSYTIISNVVVGNITNSCIWNTCVTWQGTDYNLPEYNTIESKHFRSVIICEIIMYLLAIVQYKKIFTVQGIKIVKINPRDFNLSNIAVRTQNLVEATAWGFVKGRENMRFEILTQMLLRAQLSLVATRVEWRIDVSRLRMKKFLSYLNWQPAGSSFSRGHKKQGNCFTFINRLRIAKCT